jgi:3-phosphoshikimate 1-carboxyvinyltransferase
MSEFLVKPTGTFAAEMMVPGDKSISHRAVILGALSNGPCEISGFLPSEDCVATVNALRALGVKIEELEHDQGGPVRLLVHGKKGEFKKPTEPIDCGNSGTAMRLLSGVLSGLPFRTDLTGDESLSGRPMGRIIDPLEQMGASIKGKGEKRMAPLIIVGSDELKNIEYEMPMASAQVKSAILLAALRARGRTQVTEPAQTRDHTERMLKYFLVKTLREENTVSIWGGQIPESRDFAVPGDISSAAFWIVAAAARPGAHLLVRNVGLNPTRTGILKTLVRMGAHINEIVEEHDGEPRGVIEVHGSQLHGTEIDGDEIPNVIDEIPVLAVAAALAEGTTKISDAKELRVKESDRIATTADNLRRMGVPVQEFVDGMEITGGETLKGARCDSMGDHRIAMAFAVAGLFAEGETIIDDVDCVNTSYPGFGDELAQLSAAQH